MNTKHVKLYDSNPKLALHRLHQYMIHVAPYKAEGERDISADRYREMLGIPYEVAITTPCEPIEVVGHGYTVGEEIPLSVCSRGHLYRTDTQASCPFCENTFKPIDYQPLHIRRTERALNWGFVVVAVALLCGFVWAMGSGAEQDAKNQEQYLSGYPKQEVRDVR